MTRCPNLRWRSTHLRLIGLFALQLVCLPARGDDERRSAPNEDARTCDFEAASVYDAQKPADAPGVAFEALRAATAIPACEAAHRAAPQDARLMYQLARGYRRAGRFTEALALYRQAADLGNALAANDLAHMYAKGEGVPVDLKTQLYFIDRAARAGLSVAEYNYGMLYKKGNSVLPKDDGLSRQLVSLAAKQAYPPAMNELGVMLATGVGGDKDEVEARHWYEKAALAGYEIAMNNYGFFLKTGKGGPRDLTEARRWFEKAAKGRVANAANNLAIMYAEGLGGPQDAVEARRLFEKAIALGDKRYAAENLAKLDIREAKRSQSGANLAAPEARKVCDVAAANSFDKTRPTDVPGVAFAALDASVAIPACEDAVRAAPQDPRLLYQLARAYRRAERYSDALAAYVKAAQMGSGWAANDLSGMYQTGQGVAADPKMQLFYIDQAARAGIAVAQLNYGFLYAKGSAVLPKDERLARDLIALAAKDNYAPAMNALGLMYEKGMGGGKDEGEARAWFYKAAQAGNFGAMNNYGIYLQTGRAGTKDLAEARRWFEKAAAGHDADGTNSLALMFEKGWGGPQDLGEARRLYEKAVSLGDRRFAQKNLDRLKAVAGR